MTISTKNEDEFSLDSDKESQSQSKTIGKLYFLEKIKKGKKVTKIVKRLIIFVVENASQSQKKTNLFWKSYRKQF